MVAWLRRSGVSYGALAALALLGLSFVVLRPAGVAGGDFAVLRPSANTPGLALFGVTLALFAAAFGAGLGLWARWAAGPGVRGAAAFAVGLVALNARAMAQYPALYAEYFHLRGGALQGVQTVVTALPNPLWALLPIGVYTLLGLRDRPPRLPARLLALAVLPALLPAAPAAQPARPNILILAADSLRPDYLSETRTPHIADLALAGAYWTQTYVGAPDTFPSWGELLSARYAPRTGIRQAFPAPEEERRFTPLSLVAAFQRAGYRTFAVADDAGDVFTRFDAGFDTLRAPAFDGPGLAREALLRTQPWLYGALAWRPMRELFPELRGFAELADPAWLTTDLTAELPDGGEARPFFGVAFYSVAHAPYAVPFPDYKSEADPGYDGPYRFGKPALAGAPAPTGADVRQLRALFAGAVRAFDREVGEVRRTLTMRGLEKRTVVVILADHGENLFERPGDAGHGDHLAGSESLRIPFIAYDPTGVIERGTRGRLVQAVDVLPTLLAAAGIAPPAGIDGYSVAATGAGRTAVFAESVAWRAGTSPLFDGERSAYPAAASLVTVDTAHGSQFVLQAAARPLVLAAKHQMAFDGRYKVLYVPTLAGVRWAGIDRQTDPGETAPFEIPRPGAWPADAGAREPLRALQAALVEHALAAGAAPSSAGWLLPGDGTWAP
jgi:arylsulfatase A-like enzyme